MVTMHVKHDNIINTQLYVERYRSMVSQSFVVEKLITAMIQKTPALMALKLLSCFFTKEEIVNSTPTGTTTSKDERRIKTVQKLDPVIMQYIKGK